LSKNGISPAAAGWKRAEFFFMSATGLETGGVFFMSATGLEAGGVLWRKFEAIIVNDLGADFKISIYAIFGTQGRGFSRQSSVSEFFLMGIAK
jgi:hypothetical protein